MTIPHQITPESSHSNGAAVQEKSPALELFQQRFDRLVDNVASVVVTSPHNIRLALLGLFAQGHVLLEDLPGVGKTLLAKTCGVH